MPNEQLYLALGIPALLNVGLTALILAYINRRIQELQADISASFGAVITRLEILDACLKHLEESAH